MINLVLIMYYSPVKKSLYHHFLNKTQLNIDNIQDIFDLAFFKPRSNDELKDAVKLWISDEEENVMGAMPPITCPEKTTKHPPEINTVPIVLNVHFFNFLLQ